MIGLLLQPEQAYMITYSALILATAAQQGSPCRQSLHDVAMQHQQVAVVKQDVAEIVNSRSVPAEMKVSMVTVSGTPEETNHRE